TALSIFALAALLIAVAGVYGIVSYTVNQQTRDIGLRLALGADRFDVLWMTMSRTTRMAAVGFGLGLSGASLVTRFLAAQLYGITSTDSSTFIVTAGVLILATAVASYVPARRACRIDPARALRYE